MQTDIDDAAVFKIAMIILSFLLIPMGLIWAWAELAK